MPIKEQHLQGINRPAIERTPVIKQDRLLMNKEKFLGKALLFMHVSCSRDILSSPQDIDSVNTMLNKEPNILCS